MAIPTEQSSIELPCDPQSDLTTLYQHATAAGRIRDSISLQNLINPAGEDLGPTGASELICGFIEIQSMLNTSTLRVPFSTSDMASPSMNPRMKQTPNVNVPIPVLPQNDGRMRAKEDTDHISFCYCLGADTKASVFGLKNVAFPVDIINYSRKIRHQADEGKHGIFCNNVRRTGESTDIHKTKHVWARRLVGLVACQIPSLVKTCFSGSVVNKQDVNMNGN